MPLSVGDTIPAATMQTMGDAGPQPVELGPMLSGRKVVLFGLPGAFTGTCTTAHVPSFIRTRDQLAEKGVDDIICIAVNDAFVMDAFGKATGGAEAGITFLADPAAELTKAIDMAFTVPAAGFYDRCQRFAALVVDGKVEIVLDGDKPGLCDLSSGEAMVDALSA